MKVPQIPARLHFASRVRFIVKASEPRWKTVGPQFVTLPINLVHDAGIAGLHSQDIVLYVRERCFQQLKFLNIFVINQQRLGRNRLVR